MTMRTYGCKTNGSALRRPYKSTNHLKARWSRTEEHNFRRSFKKTNRQIGKRQIAQAIGE